MTTYDGSSLTDTFIAHKKGITLQQGRALRDNPIAMAEGAPGAPRFALKTDSAAFTTGNADFNSLDSWSGCWFSVMAYNANGVSARNLSFDATDGSYLGAKTLLAVPTTTFVTLTGFFDFATGLVHGVYGGGTTAGVFSQTIAGASLSITGVRFKGTTDLTCGVFVSPNGGESAS